MRRYFFDNFIGVLCSCLLFNALAMADVDGWASMNGGTTGGAGGPTVIVTNEADLRTYATSATTGPYIIQVQGSINLTQRLDISPNKTLMGIGENPTITGYNLRIRGQDSGGVPLGYNIIVKNLIIAEHSGGDSDGLTIQDSAHHIWVDHCTFYDCADGCLDITHGSDYITVSWCKFYYVNQSSHRNVNLTGHDDDNASEDTGKLHVTFHHNWYSQDCDQRMPSVRYGTAHIYNSYFDCPGNLYCIRTRLYAQCLVENNYFKKVQNPWERYVTSAGGDPGLLYASGNILDNVSWDDTYDPGQIVLIDGNDAVFTPPYSYTLDNAQDVPVIVQYGAGANGKEGYPPHWYFGMYGDFDRSGIVDVNDLGPFSDYWLAETDIDNADYDDSGRVDYSEFALLAGNYLYIPPDTTPPEAPTDVWALGQNEQVTLDWADNSEEDLAGYNVYRSTTSGSGYTKLNDLLLTNSEYTDGIALNGTMYYYIATSVDTNNNESGNSVEACAVPDATSDNVVIQENSTGFCISSDIEGIESEHSGYTGSGYANTANASGMGVDWSINITTAGTYTFTWRFANNSSDRPAKLLINDVEEVASINFAATGAWSSWTTVSAQVTLTTGAKSIRLEATTSGGCANIDYLQVAGAGVEIASCP